jgi:hypothetical protein
MQVRVHQSIRKVTAGLLDNSVAVCIGLIVRWRWCLISFMGQR